MKKQIVICIFLTLVLATIAAIPSTVAHTEDEPSEIPLLAGQDNPVGKVNVWNDETNLYVDYIITECGWEILDTHLYVGKTNPNTLTTAPGQFPYSGETEYIIPLSEICQYEMELNKKGNPTGKIIPKDGGICGVDSDDSVYIAAHADVRFLESIEWNELITNGGFETPAISSSWTIVPDSELPGWSTAPASHATIEITDLIGLEIQKNLFVTAYEGDQYAELDAYYPIVLTQIVPACESGEYRISYAFSARPGVDINQMDVVFGDDEYTATHFVDGNPYLTGWCHWASTEFTGPTQGTADLVFTETGPDDQLGMFLDDVSLEGKVYNYIYESAWGEGYDFEHPNWAMYFTYDVQGWELYDTFTVPATTATPTLSDELLESGVVYKIEAIGTYFFRNEGNSQGYLADAEYALRHDAYGEGWVKGDSAPYSSPYNGLDLCNDAGTNIDWGDLDETYHTYSILYTGTGGYLSLFIKDNAYGDNSGYLTVNIYEWA